MAATIGSRDGSGPINGTGAGPETGLGALATVDFACAAASFAADVRSPLVSANLGAAGAVFGGAFFAGAFLAGAFFAGVFLAALAGAFLAALAGAFLAALAGVSVAGGGGVRQAGPDRGLARTTPARLPVLRRQPSRRVDPAGLPFGCSFAPVSSTRQWLPSCQAGNGG